MTREGRTNKTYTLSVYSDCEDTACTGESHINSYSGIMTIHNLDYFETNEYAWFLNPHQTGTVKMKLFDFQTTLCEISLDKTFEGHSSIFKVENSESIHYNFVVENDNTDEVKEILGG